GVDKSLGLVRLADEPARCKINHGGTPAAIELLRQAVAAACRDDVGFDKRAATAVGSQRLHGAGRAGVGLEEQRVERIEAGGLAVLVAGAENVHPVADVLDRNAPYGEAPDCVKVE